MGVKGGGGTHKQPPGRNAAASATAHIDTGCVGWCACCNATQLLDICAFLFLVQAMQLPFPLNYLLSWIEQREVARRYEHLNSQEVGGGPPQP